MWQRCVVILLLALTWRHPVIEAELDLNYLCRGQRLGAIIANPLDCGAYFVCGELRPTLHQCGDGMHFDAERKVCNWPEQVNCKYGVTVYPVFNETEEMSTTTTMSTPTTVPTPEATDPTPATTVPTSNPTGHTTKPTDPTQDPTVHTTKPTDPTQDPTVHTTKPTDPTQDPTVHTTKPTDPTQDPTVHTTKPTDPTPATTVPTPATTVPTSNPTVPTSNPTVPTSNPTVPTTTTDYPSTFDSSTNTTPDFGSWEDVRLTFAAVSVATGSIVDAMTGYNPQQVHCLHRGVYFLPHPRSCERYFLCAFGHLLAHQCGRGTVWSYRRWQCEIAAEGDCYATSDGDQTTVSTFEPTTGTSTASTGAWTTTTSGTTTVGGAEDEQTVCYPVTTTVQGGTITTWHPTGTIYTSTGTSSTPITPIYPTTPTTPAKTPATYEPTVCYPVSTTGGTETTWYPTGSIYTATKTTVTEAPTTPETPKTTAETERTTTGTTATSSGDRQDEVTVSCSEGVKYLADPKDCSRYYICIQRMPIGMDCPQGSYWDDIGEFCTAEAKSRCQ